MARREDWSEAWDGGPGACMALADSEAASLRGQVETLQAEVGHLEDALSSLQEAYVMDAWEPGQREALQAQVDSATGYVNERDSLAAALAEIRRLCDEAEKWPYRDSLTARRFAAAIRAALPEETTNA